MILMKTSMATLLTRIISPMYQKNTQFKIQKTHFIVMASRPRFLALDADYNLAAL
jgi:hypothetical protein